MKQLLLLVAFIVFYSGVDARSKTPRYPNEKTKPNKRYHPKQQQDQQPQPQTYIKGQTKRPLFGSKQDKNDYYESSFDDQKIYNRVDMLVIIVIVFLVLAVLSKGMKLVNLIQNLRQQQKYKEIRNNFKNHTYLDFQQVQTNQIQMQDQQAI